MKTFIFDLPKSKIRKQDITTDFVYLVNEGFYANMDDFSVIADFNIGDKNGVIRSIRAIQRNLRSGGFGMPQGNEFLVVQDYISWRLFVKTRDWATRAAFYAGILHGENRYFRAKKKKSRNNRKVLTKN